MNNAPIGVFDSGLGGLTGVREFLRILPDENIVFFGDTSRVPYGTRSVSTIIKYAQQDVQFLLSKNVKMVIPVCGTVSSTFPKELADALPVPYMDVIFSTVNAALATTQNGKIGVVGTPATIKSNSYTRAIAAQMPTAVVTANGCPLLVPLVENGYIAPDNFVTRSVAEEYFAPILKAGVDTIILGCTHYPIIEAIIRQIVGPDIHLINPGKEVAHSAAQFLKENDMLATPGNNATVDYYVSDTADSFNELASIFLGMPVTNAQKIDIESI